MNQLTLAFEPQRRPARQLPAIERLRQVLTRQGFDWRYRAMTGSTLMRPLLASRFGWQLMCGRYCCSTPTFERIDGYCDRPVLVGEERISWAWWRETVYRPDLYELWGAP